MSAEKEKERVVFTGLAVTQETREDVSFSGIQMNGSSVPKGDVRVLLTFHSTSQSFLWKFNFTHRAGNMNWQEAAKASSLTGGEVIFPLRLFSCAHGHFI